MARREKEKSVSNPADEYPGSHVGGADTGEILTVFKLALNFSALKHSAKLSSWVSVRLSLSIASCLTSLVHAT